MLEGQFLVRNDKEKVVSELAWSICKYNLSLAHTSFFIFSAFLVVRWGTLINKFSARFCVVSERTNHTDST